MTATVARLLLAVLIFPLSLIVFFLSAAGFLATVTKGVPGFERVIGVWATTYTFIVTYWIYVWRPTVKWSRRRMVGTAIAGLAAIATAVPLYVGINTIGGPPPQMAMMASGAVPPVVWVLLTVLLWRETSAERLERLRRRGPDTVACPVCGYNLTGLREAKCPECGSAFEAVRSEPVDVLLKDGPEAAGARHPVNSTQHADEDASSHARV